MSFTSSSTSFYEINNEYEYISDSLLSLHGENEEFEYQFSASKLPSYLKWRKTPRTPADFSPSSSSNSLCGDSEYEAWLEDYYATLRDTEETISVDEKGIDTCDLPREEESRVLLSLFQGKKDPWFKCTKYWGPEEPRRHWALLLKRSMYSLFPTIHPDLNLRSRYGRYHSLLNSAAAVPETHHKHMVSVGFKKNLDHLLVIQPNLVKILYCDNLYNLQWFDFLTKMVIVRTLSKFLRVQSRLEEVSFENANLERLEGIILLCSLSRSAGYTLKKLFMWRMFNFGQCPLLTNEIMDKRKNKKKNFSIKFFTKIHYLQILNNFENLTHLSMNYAYLANKKGDALLCLKCVETGTLKELRILCSSCERPLKTNPCLGVGGYMINDGVWRKVVELCPDLRVKFVFLNLPQYENVILFLSKSIPMSCVYISSGVLFNFEVPWEIDSTLLELRNWYSSTLDTLSLHLWHQKDFLDVVIKNKILEEFPNLETFEFIGILEDVETLEKFCCRLSRGTYKLKNLLFWVQEKSTNEKKLKIRERVTEIRDKYHRRFQSIEIDANIGTYAM